ncbi:hypothetical protein NDU88_004679 [Pleurodeles waltl]|uniref:Integrase catalytic domain-containing protein n=1 Tax=Pleurodeles waltl TaxID=8319 RepID=A0AAV7QII7_PLEWA|nr:hypothetical protein NDU88_004679 [Pleurodeles waltl]
MDDYAHYPEVEIVTTTCATEVIPKMEKIMATHGLFGEVRKDNGLPFNSHKWAEFLQSQNINHCQDTPRRPQANREVKRFVPNAVEDRLDYTGRKLQCGTRHLQLPPGVQGHSTMPLQGSPRVNCALDGL